MTKSQLIERIAREQSDRVERDVAFAVNRMLEHMTVWLTGGGRIEFQGVGSFSLRYRRARVARNPRTGTRVDLGVRYAHTSSPGSGFVHASMRDSRPPNRRRSPTTDGQFGASAPVAAAVDHARGETDWRLRRSEIFLLRNCPTRLNFPAFSGPF